MKEYLIKFCICFTITGAFIALEKLMPTIGVSFPFVCGWLCSLVWYSKDEK